MGAAHLRLALARDAGDARRARSYVRRVCTAFDPEVVTTAELLTTELFSNALKHGTGPIMLNVSLDDELLRVEVSDTSPGVPVVGRPGPEDASGRGLFLVEALAREWGVARFPHSAGKVVWFTLDVAA